MRERLFFGKAIYLLQSLPVVGRALGSPSAGRPALEIAYRCKNRRLMAVRESTTDFKVRLRLEPGFELHSDRRFDRQP